ncbi:MAG: leucine--tRNA ligase [Streptosporangiales bacterium]|nr:leucine--tRNA ligase [Streptosporangiales bacterium]
MSATDARTGREAPDETPYRYTPAMANEIESKWQDRWQKERVYEAPNPAGPMAEPEAIRGREKFFLLDMFPYPSAAGMHVGHPLGYVGTDVFGRYKRMRGYNVLHSMGFDAFGLPAEQYAVQTGQHPRVTTERNIANIRRQLRMLGLGFDWRRSIETIDPGYYRWTQWIFLKLFESFYDEEQERARPVGELVAEYESGQRATPDGRPWAELSEAERRAVVDDRRLAYISDAPVNWCPGLGTVVANEEVTADGRSERGNFPVFRRSLSQWMLRITAYADRLTDDLETIDWPDAIKTMQRNWIGRSHGANVVFPATTSGGEQRGIEVFTTRPDTLFGATFMVLAPEHPLVDELVPDAWPAADLPAPWTGGAASPQEAVRAYRTQTGGLSDVERQVEAREKTGVFTGAYATNPANGAQIPVFIADYVLLGYGTGAIMAVPGQDERDWAYAEKYELPIVRTVQPPADFDGEAYVGEGPAINSSNPETGLSLDGLGVEDAKKRIIAWLEEHGHGEGTVTYKMRDWLFSRQRYWGEPFPIVHDEHGPVAVPDEQLPVLLPDVPEYSPRLFDPDDADSEPESPLSRVGDWVEVTLDLGDGQKKYRRETNVMPQWAGSCWYELRYLDPENAETFCDPENEAYWMGPRGGSHPGGVDLYVGGVEHGVLHLLYARFWHKVLYDLGYVSSKEPYYRLYNQGYIQAYAYTDSRGVYVPAEEVETETRDGETIYLYKGQPVKREYGKMGKSLKNIVTPDDMCAQFGADTFRVYEMSTGPLDASRPWETQAVVGAQRLLQRVWRNVVDEHTGELQVVDAEADTDTRAVLHCTIDAVRKDYEGLRFNTAIARITELNNHLTQAVDELPREVAEPLVLVLAPLAPHLAEELWERLGHGDSLVYQAFPEPDESYLAAQTVVYPVQVAKKVRGRVEIAADASEDEVRAAALADEGVQRALDGREPRKVIVVPGRMVSIVV